MAGLPGKAALRLVAGSASLAAGGLAFGVLRGTPAALGASAGAIHAACEGSPHYRDGAFHNIEPDRGLRLDVEENRLVLFDAFARASESRPRSEIPLENTRASRAEELAVTWLGHATALLEVDGYRLLTDPVWSERCSPSNTLGPRRLHPPPVPLDALPALDAVLISHDHYDHLDMATVQTLARTQRAPFFVPLGVGAHLREWGIPAGRIIEHDWNAVTRLGDVRLACMPARHFSGRFLSRNNTLWCSWAVLGPQHRAFFGGDSGYTRSYADIGEQHGPFDLTVLPIGAYSKSWPDIHMNPEEAVRAHCDLNGGDLASGGGGLLMPIHWGTFRLAPHPWAEPPERLLVAADAAGVQIAIPKPGGRVVAGEAFRPEPWWRL